MTSMLTVDSSKRPSAKELLESEYVKQMRKVIFDDIDLISNYPKSSIGNV